MSPLLSVLGAAQAPSTALPAHPGLLENLQFQGVGLVIVMTALTGIYLLCAGLGLVFQRLDARSQVPAPAQPKASEPAAEVPVAVVAAAVAVALEGRPHRVVSVAPAAGNWTQEGRRQLLSSHQPKK